MNIRLRRSAYLRSFFVLCAASVIRSEGLEELIGRAGTPQIEKQLKYT